ncbi:hypothetical protein [Carp edema virus]|nr:hypothetical protein [Carp edema virus]
MDQTDKASSTKITKFRSIGKKPKNRESLKKLETSTFDPIGALEKFKATHSSQEEESVSPVSTPSPEPDFRVADVLGEGGVTSGVDVTGSNDVSGGALFTNQQDSTAVMPNVPQPVMVTKPQMTHQMPQMSDDDCCNSHSMITSFINFFYPQSSRDRFKDMFRSISTIFYTTHFINIFWVRMLVCFTLYSIFVQDLAIAATIFTAAGSQLLPSLALAQPNKNMLYIIVLLCSFFVMLLSHKFSLVSLMFAQILLIVLFVAVHGNYFKDGLLAKVYGGSKDSDEGVDLREDAVGGEKATEESETTEALVEDTSKIDQSAFEVNADSQYELEEVLDLQAGDCMSEYSLVSESDQFENFGF